jgi:hypothetical protein
MSFIAAAVIGAGAALGGAYLASNAAEDAAETQAAAADRAAALQNEQFKQTREDQLPFLEAGYKGQNRLMDLLGLSDNRGAAGYGSAAKNFSMSDFEQDPGYAFRMSEGLKALDRTAAARGGMLSGAALRGATRYGQGLASEEYTNAYNRYNTNRENILNPLLSISGKGQLTANELGNAGQNYATNAGNAYMNAGNAAASGYVGSANAWNSALGTAANSYMQSQMLNRLIPSSSPYTSASNFESRMGLPQTGYNRPY